MIKLIFVLFRLLNLINCQPEISSTLAPRPSQGPQAPSCDPYISICDNPVCEQPTLSGRTATVSPNSTFFFYNFAPVPIIWNFANSNTDYPRISTAICFHY
jgi:hypothetical protein